MLGTIEKLLELQKTDRLLLALAKEERDIPARREEIETKLRSHHQAAQQVQEEIKKNDLAIGRCEGEVKDLDQKITRLRQQQFQIKTNDDYRLLEKEIEEIGKHEGLIEDQELALLEKKDLLLAELAQKQKAIKDEEVAIQKELDFLGQRLLSINEELASEKERRHNLAAQIDEQPLRRYERIFQHKGDYALVAIEKGCCTGCHMRLPPQLIRNAHKAQELVTCDFCSRILYWSSEHELSY